MKKVLHIDENHPALSEGIARFGFENHFDFTSGKATVENNIADYIGLVVRSRFPIDSIFLKKATALKFIIRVGAGLENIDTDFAKKMGIHLIAAPQGNATAVGEHALGMLLALFNNIPRADAQIKREKKWLREANRGEELSGKTVGIIGYGNMGKSFARKLQGFDVKVLCYDILSGVGDDFATQVSLDTLQKKAEIISIHTPENERSVGMINKHFINACHRSFFLVNTARGSAVVTKDVLNGLKNGNIRGACLDVLEYEQSSFENIFERSKDRLDFKELLQHPNVLLSPHIAGWTHQSLERLAVVCLEKLKLFIKYKMKNTEKQAPVLFENLIKNFPFAPTKGQKSFLEKIAHFIFDNSIETIFILRGYAGTGKTTLLSSLIAPLKKQGITSVLLAPTGRAAKVMTSYTGCAAFTVHKKIYYPKTNSGGNVEFVLKKNTHSDTVFFVDEASMIAGDTNEGGKLFDGGSFLEDLIGYVYEGKRCKLVFIGDTAQLPPVKSDASPALEDDTLGRIALKKIFSHTLTEVTRQKNESGILYNATNLRQTLTESFFGDFQFSLDYPDVIRLQHGDDIRDTLTQSYEKDPSETVVIVRSNKRANQYNDQIRNKIFGWENQIAVGDQLMCVRNNYFWLDGESPVGFIANGDTFEITEIIEYQKLYGFHFAKVKVVFIDYPKVPPISLTLLLDTLQMETPNLPFEESNRLYQEVARDYQNESKYKRMMKVKSNPYFNAVQVKYAYALTCHKAQGGQWNRVFVEQPYLPDGVSQDYYRWLYTAMTRAKECLFLIGFKDEFFEEI